MRDSLAGARVRLSSTAWFHVRVGIVRVYSTGNARMRYAHGNTIASLLTAALLLVSCQSIEVVDSPDQFAAVITLVDSGPVLSSARTFVLPDTIARLSPTGGGMGHEASSAIVARVR